MTATSDTFDPSLYAISKTDSSILVRAPYNPSFNELAKRDLGAKYKAGSWVFDARDEAAARKLVLERYGYADGEELVSVRVTAVNEIKGCQEPIIRLGRVLAAATGRDSGARLGDGVRLEGGSTKSAGSTKNWTTVIAAGSVLVVHDIPARMATTYANEPGRDGLNVELIEKAMPNAEFALFEERGKLVARLAEIDSALAATISA